MFAGGARHVQLGVLIDLCTISSADQVTASRSAARSTLPASLPISRCARIMSLPETSSLMIMLEFLPRNLGLPILPLSLVEPGHLRRPLLLGRCCHVVFRLSRVHTFQLRDRLSYFLLERWRVTGVHLFTVKQPR